MRAHEFITEAINYTRHVHDITQIVYDGIAEAIKTMGPQRYQYSSEYEKYRNEVNREGSIYPLEEKVKKELYDRILYFVGKKLENIASNILNVAPSSYIPVSFETMKSGGEAGGLSVTLNEEFIKQLAAPIFEMLVSTVYSNFGGGEELYDFFWKTIQRTNFVDEIKSDFEIRDLVFHWVSIFIHELVHVRQHLPQIKKGIKNTEYRSYLDDFKGEFLKLHSEKYDKDSEPSARWWDLYAASPQEIAARAHQAALTILNYYVRYPEDLEYLDNEGLRKIKLSVPEFIAHSYFKKPETPRERRVYRRYIQKTLEQINDYIEHHSPKKLDESENKPKVISSVDGKEYFDTPNIRKLLKQAENMTVNLPKVKNGYTRLWRGNRPDEVGKNPSFTNYLVGIALPFLNMYGGKLSYIDIPTKDMEKYVFNIGSAEDSEFMLPPEIARTAKTTD